MKLLNWGNNSFVYIGARKVFIWKEKNDSFMELLAAAKQDVIFRIE